MTVQAPRVVQLASLPGSSAPEQEIEFINARLFISRSGWERGYSSVEAAQTSLIPRPFIIKLERG